MFFRLNSGKLFFPFGQRGPKQHLNNSSGKWNGAIKPNFLFSTSLPSEITCNKSEQAVMTPNSSYPILCLTQNFI
jgi:hypothetical protein